MSTQDNSKRQQQVSAILDDDLNHQELNEFMQDLARDPVADAERVQRYQMMGDVLRDDLNEASFMDISAVVRRAVDQQPEYQSLESNATTKKDSKPWFDLSAWTKPLTGIAIAASVAMVTVVSFRAVETDSINNSVQTVADVEFKKTTVVPVNPLIANQLRLVSAAESKTKSQLQAQQLSDYMMRHSDSAGQSTMQGMMPYVRVVGFDAHQQQQVNPNK